MVVVVLSCMSVSFRTRPSSPELTSEHFVCMLCEMWGGAIERFVERQAVCKLGTSKMTFTWIRKSLDCRSLGGDVADEDSHVIDCAPSRSIHGLFVMLAFLHQHERWQLLLVSFSRSFNTMAPPHTREKLNTLEPTFPLGLPVCLLYLGVVCKPVQIFPCMGWHPL
jgi:hypothetical protein